VHDEAHVAVLALLFAAVRGRRLRDGELVDNVLLAGPGDLRVFPRGDFFPVAKASQTARLVPLAIVRKDAVRVTERVLPVEQHFGKSTAALAQVEKTLLKTRDKR
jgi:hypothetical protein